MWADFMDYGADFCIVTDLLAIRPARTNPEGLVELLRVYQQCEDFLALGPVSTASIDMIQADLRTSAQTGGIYCGIYDRGSGETVGVVDFVLSGWLGSPELAYLSLLMISTAHRNRGLGASVVRAIEQYISRDVNVRAIHAGVQVNNLAAIRFWLRMGYQIISGPELQPDSTVSYHLLKDNL